MAGETARQLSAAVLLLLGAVACAGGGSAPDPDIELGSAPARKRAAPAEVAPVTRDAVRYEVVHWGKARGLPQNGGYVAAVDAASGEERWLLRVYATSYDASLEADKQDVFITRLRLRCGGECLEVDDERGRRYRVDLASRSVARL
jgi:hypothetical protein